MKSQEQVCWLWELAWWEEPALYLTDVHTRNSNFSRLGCVIPRNNTQIKMTGIDEKFPARLSWSSIAAFLLEFAHTVFPAQTLRTQAQRTGPSGGSFCWSSCNCSHASPLFIPRPKTARRGRGSGPVCLTCQDTVPSPSRSWHWSERVFNSGWLESLLTAQREWNAATYFVTSSPDSNCLVQSMLTPTTLAKGPDGTTTSLGRVYARIR